MEHAIAHTSTEMERSADMAAAAATGRDWIAPTFNGVRRTQLLQQYRCRAHLRKLETLAQD